MDSRSERAWLVEPGRVEWRESSRPLLMGNDALIRPVAVAICDADVGAWAGQLPLPMPYELGHEFVGVVEDIADEVASQCEFQVGDLVAVPFQVSCGRCSACTDGRTASCKGAAGLSMYGFGAVGGDWGGALADVVRVPYASHMLVPVPREVDELAAANAGDNLADAWRMTAPWLEGPGPSSVLVFGGAGRSIALWAAELSAAFGADVTYIDSDDGRLALAEAVVTTVIEGPPRRVRGDYSLVIDADGTAEGLRAALRSTSSDGICVSAGIHFEDVALPLLEMYSKNITFVIGRPHSRSLLPLTLDAIARRVIDPLRIATVIGRGDLDDALRSGLPKTVVSLR